MSFPGITMFVVQVSECLWHYVNFRYKKIKIKTSFISCQWYDTDKNQGERAIQVYLYFARVVNWLYLQCWSGFQKPETVVTSSLGRRDSRMCLKAFTNWFPVLSFGTKSVYQPLIFNNSKYVLLVVISVKWNSSYICTKN